MSLQLEVANVTKRFTRKPVFAPISFSAAPSEIIAITGSNGSGKSTLLKIIARVLEPSKGTCVWSDNGKPLEPEELSRRMGFVAPYFELYNELTAVEHVNFIAQLKGQEHATPVESLTSFGLDRSIAESARLVGQYSSGMRQRVALAMSASGAPDILLYDEPSSNLDEEGVHLLFESITAAAKNGAIVVLATNDVRERGLAHRTITLLPA